ncbi:MAG: hypothetical protein K2K84_06820, partial [Muribaculaceae bacterium]|nr:hypothetical protein [Muribaculaceae bacterium]
LADSELTMAEPDDDGPEEKKSDAKKADKEEKPTSTPAKAEEAESKSDQGGVGDWYRVPDSYSPLWDGPDIYKLF